MLIQPVQAGQEMRIMWYVIQTTTGKEQELVDVIHRIFPRTVYRDCFFMKRQLLKRLGGRWLEVTETLFPAYVFLDIEDYESVLPAFYELKKIPEYSKLLGDNLGDFIPLDESETSFLMQLCTGSDDDHLVETTKVCLNNQGDIIKLEGPLEQFREKIVKLNLRKRYAIVEIMMRGEMRTVMLGVQLEKDPENR